MLIKTLNKENKSDDQMRLEFLKLETTNFSIHYLISKTREKKG